MSVFSIHKNNFKDQVLNAEQPVLIDLWATWCGPCRMMSPVVEAIAEEHPEIKVCKINVDDDPELAQAFQVSAIPTLVLVQGGTVRSVSVGVQPKGQIEDMLRSNLSANVQPEPQRR